MIQPPQGSSYDHIRGEIVTRKSKRAGVRENSPSHHLDVRHGFPSSSHQLSLRTLRLADFFSASGRRPFPRLDVTTPKYLRSGATHGQLCFICPCAQLYSLEGGRQGLTFRYRRCFVGIYCRHSYFFRRRHQGGPKGDVSSSYSYTGPSGNATLACPSRRETARDLGFGFVLGRVGTAGPPPAATFLALSFLSILSIFQVHCSLLGRIQS